MRKTSTTHKQIRDNADALAWVCYMVMTDADGKEFVYMARPNMPEITATARARGIKTFKIVMVQGKKTPRSKGTVVYENGTYFAPYAHLNK